MSRNNNMGAPDKFFLLVALVYLTFSFRSTSTYQDKRWKCMFLLYLKSHATKKIFDNLNLRPTGATNFWVHLQQKESQPGALRMQLPS